jgi:hypothetical protein
MDMGFGHPHCMQNKSFQSLRVLLTILLIFRANNVGSKKAGGGIGGGELSLAGTISEV